MISIIVPVYQSASYISVCVRSVLQQTRADLELLLVDDGSADQTREICEKFQESDPRVRLLPRKHEGVSAARNAGIREARGEYLFFLDSDDAIHARLLETLHRRAEETGAVITGCAYDCIQSAVFREHTENMEGSAGAGKGSYMKNPKAMEYFFEGGGAGRLLSIGGKLIRRDAAGAVRFDEGLSYGEDTKFIYELIAGGADVCILPVSWYYYRMHKSNVSRMQTLAAYKSMYRTERYICDHEWKSGRKANAEKEEYVLTRRMLDWYMTSREERDKKRIVYLKGRAASERKLEVWGRLSLAARAEFCLAFCCPVLYTPFYRLIKILWKLTCCPSRT